MNVALGTVIYEAAMKYSSEFLESVKQQSNSDFDILIINDDVEENSVKLLKKQLPSDTTIINKPFPMSIAALRVYLVYIAKKMGYDLLIWADFDDTFCTGRITNIIDVYSDEYTFYYNQLVVYGNQNVVFKKLPKKIESIDPILQCNFLGLSNTAINLKQISIKFIESLYECNTNIFDWYFYSRLLLNGAKGVFVPEAETYYRIHENNIAGLNENNMDELIKEVNVKKQHYMLLSKYADCIQTYYNKYVELPQISLQQNPKNTNLGYWWSKIQL